MVRPRRGRAPSQAQHRGASNAPHLTLLATPRIEAVHLGAVVDMLGPFIPVAVDVSGYAVFGDGARHTLALLCAVPSTFAVAVEQLTQAVGAGQGRAWVPHLTLARRLTATQVGRALEVLGDQGIPPCRVTLVGVRHWDPATRSVTTVLG